MIDTQKDENQDQITVQVMSAGLDFFMPDSIPEIVREKAFELAFQNKYSNYRILQVRGEQESTFNILYFKENDMDMLKSVNVSLNENENTVSSIMNVTDAHLSFLRKGVSETAVCWKLGDMCDTSPFNISYAFQFGQSAISYGWFSKVIYDLRNDQLQCCCGDEYYYYASLHNLNDKISSNRWRDDRSNYSAVGRIARPYRLSIYKGSDAQGTKKRWTASGYSSNYYNPERSIDIVNYDDWNYEDGTSCNNSVTSILFEYRVFTPIYNP